MRIDRREVFGLLVKTEEQDESAIDDFELDEVAAPAVTGSQLRLRSGLDGIVATGFPPDWTLRAGDLVLIDHQQQLAYPFVEMRGSRWYARRRDRSQQRVIAEREA